jgi:hypothetical protein
LLVWFGTQVQVVPFRQTNLDALGGPHRLAFREVRVYEIKEVLRLWLSGEGQR